MPLGWHLFLLGLSAGLSLLPLSAYRRVSPRWLAGALIISGLIITSRYPLMALAAQSPPTHVPAWGDLAHGWFAGILGWILPAACAVDQLLRHPAMTPSKLARWVAPVIVLHGLLLALSHTRQPGAIPWYAVLSGVQLASVIGFIGICAFFWAKVPVRPIRLALGGLILAAAALGLDGAPYSDMLASVALWHAYETARQLS